MINPVSVSYAIAVADKKNITKAADILGVQQSVVSRHIRKLEETIGVSLFERSAKGVNLTNAGHIFIDKCRSVLDGFEHAVQTAAMAGRGDEGCVRIGVESSLSHGFMRDLICRYRQLYPKVALQLMEGALQEQVRELTERNIDFAFTFTKPPESVYDVAVLWESSNFVILPTVHPLAHQTSVTWAELKNEHFIVSTRAAGAGVVDYIIMHSRHLGISPTIERHKVSREMLFNLVSIGLGITIVSEASMSFKLPGIVLKKIKDKDTMIQCYGAWLPQNDNPAFRRFLSLARSKTQSSSCA